MDDARPPGAPLVAGIDFSEGARAALDTARALAARLGLGLMVTHVYEPIHSEAPDLDAGSERWLADNQVERESLHLRYGQPWIELARVARSCGAFAVVVGSHGRSGAQPVALGSTAARLGLVAPCPVIVVNTSARPACRTGDPVAAVIRQQKPFRQGTS